MPDIDISIVVPLYNEEECTKLLCESITKVMKDLNRKYEIIFIDDGSTDRTCEVAKELGVDHIIRLSKNKGLARSFTAGLDAAVKRGADFIVNTDADNQYKGEDISKLIMPLIEGKADIFVGDRCVRSIEHSCFCM